MSFKKRTNQSQSHIRIYHNQESQSKQTNTRRETQEVRHDEAR